MAQAIPILSLLIAALAVFVGPMITLRMSRRQIELSRRIAHRQIIAPMRQAWINNLRDRLAELLTLSTRCWNKNAESGYDELQDPEYKRIEELGQEIELLINPTEDDHKELVAAIKEITMSIAHGLKAVDAFSTSTARAGVLGQKIFKTEWNRIKAEIERPD